VGITKFAENHANPHSDFPGPAAQGAVAVVVAADDDDMVMPVFVHALLISFPCTH